MKLRTLLSLALLISLVGFWSCGPAENQVTVDLTTDSEFPTRGDSVSLNITVSSELENLKQVVVEVSSVDTNGNALLFVKETRDAGDLSFSGEYSFTVGEGTAFGETINVIITSTDAIDGSFETVNTDITAVAYMSVFRADAEVGHQWGPLNGGYNLVDAVQAYRDAPANTKDMVDQSEQQKVLSNVFQSNAEANTTFIDLGENYNIAELHTVSVEDVFSERSASNVITVAAGTKFIAKLRGGSDYAVVHITSIDPDYEPTTTENKGHYVFDIYKLQ
ncbi:MAG: hypothetical protein JXQ87_18785 [Bacteroidia bacterium]